jgi:hypothetical protein
MNDHYQRKSFPKAIHEYVPGIGAYHGWEIKRGIIGRAAHVATHISRPIVSYLCSSPSQQRCRSLETQAMLPTIIPTSLPP